MQGDFVQLIGKTSLGAVAAETGQAVPQGLRNGLGLGLAREPGQQFGELLGLCIADVQRHELLRVDQELHCNSAGYRGKEEGQPPKPHFPGSGNRQITAVKKKMAYTRGPTAA